MIKLGAIRKFAFDTCARPVVRQETASAVIGSAGLLLLGYSIVTASPPSMEMSEQGRERSAENAPVASFRNPPISDATRLWYVGGYGGVSFTHPSTVTIRNGDRTDMSVSDFSWIGRPFKAPIYYGLRGLTWAPGSRIGTMIDFTHAKAIANAADIATFSGKRDGKPVPSKGKISETFRHLEFSHGHNIVTLNGLLSLLPSGSRIRPYLGLGAGVSLPHSEVGFRNEKARTYEYQFAGFVGHACAGLEIPLGRISVFFEYKFTYAPYDIPLSHEPQGWVLVTDLWRQLAAWWRNEAPPGGTLTTTLTTHHGVGGILVRAR